MKENSALTYKEIYGQPASFAAINATLPEIEKTLDTVFAQQWDELIFTGCGTSLYLAQAAAFAFSSCCRIPAKGVPCSELLFFPEAFAGNGRKVLGKPRDAAEARAIGLPLQQRQAAQQHQRQVLRQAQHVERGVGHARRSGISGS